MTLHEILGLISSNVEHHHMLIIPEISLILAQSYAFDNATESAGPKLLF